MEAEHHAQPRSRLTWRITGYMPDCAFAALGDPRFLADRRWFEQGLPYLLTEADGSGMLYGKAECDGLPVELATLESDVVGVRLEFTTDIAALERAGDGRWVKLGTLIVGAGGCIAGDTKVPRSSEHTHKLALPAGRYDAEVFDWHGDHLGIRLLRGGA